MSDTNKSKKDLLHSALAGLGAALLTGVLVIFDSPPPPPPPDVCEDAVKVLTDDEFNKGLSEEVKSKIRNKALERYLSNYCGGEYK